MIIAWSSLALGLSILLAATRWNFLWKWRRETAGIAQAVVLAGGLFAAAEILLLPDIALTVYFIAALLAIFLGARMQFGRLLETELRRSTIRSSMILLFVTPVLFFTLRLFPEGFYLQAAVLSVLSGALFLALLFAFQTWYALRHYSDKRRSPAGWGHDPPTVTLAIPARNETHVLARCLDAALESNYPRLEILVLDDCSQDKTSQLIKSFAHAGVRFVQGAEPADGWLGKTNAYATLEKEATGDYILFIGVDTYLEPSAVTEMVAYAKRYSLNMLSVLPGDRQDYFLPMIMQHLRYIWHIILPTSSGHIPVSSEAWLVKREALVQAGGFSTYKQDILPEMKLARYFAEKRRYRFLIASPQLPMNYGKRWSSQFRTSTRLWYPLASKQPFAAVGLGVCLLLFGFGPFAAVILFSSAFITALALTICLLYLVTYAAILRRLQPRFWWISMWFLPFVLLQESTFVLISLAQYEFGSVNWKGRNICYTPRTYP